MQYCFKVALATKTIGRVRKLLKHRRRPEGEKA